MTHTQADIDTMQWTDNNLIFLISLPRAGSTLLQRILAGHSDISTTAESWLLLPQVYALRSGHTFSEYGHTSAANAIGDFCKHLPAKTESYIAEIKRMSIRLFQATSREDARYYLEKTPRNNLIVDELIGMFPNSYFIFLWRNPLASAASLIDTFGQGKWNLFKYTVDLYQGLDNMIKALDSPPLRFLSLRYEDLLLQPAETTGKLLGFLGIDSMPSLVDDFSEMQLPGRMGDQSGAARYKTINTEPLHKWKQTLSSPARKAWARAYLNWLGRERLAAIGYSHDELMSELNDAPVNIHTLPNDTVRMAYGYLERTLQLKMFRHLASTRKTRMKNYRLF